jgi:hypothetical protein
MNHANNKLINMKLILIINLIFLSGNCLYALPFGDSFQKVSGEVVDWAYREEITLKRSSYGNSVELVIPSHYILILKPMEMEREDIQELNNLAAFFLFQDPILQRQRDEVVLRIIVYGKKDILSLSDARNIVILENYSVKGGGFGNYEVSYGNITQRAIP